jgi:hypothetical protein
METVEREFGRERKRDPPELDPDPCSYVYGKKLYVNDLVLWPCGEGGVISTSPFRETRKTK